MLKSPGKWMSVRDEWPFPSAVLESIDIYISVCKVFEHNRDHYPSPWQDTCSVGKSTGPPVSSLVLVTGSTENRYCNMDTQLTFLTLTANALIVFCGRAGAVCIHCKKMLMIRLLQLHRRSKKMPYLLVLLLVERTGRTHSHTFYCSVAALDASATSSWMSLSTQSVEITWGPGFAIGE